MLEHYICRWKSAQKLHLENQVNICGCLEYNESVEHE